MSRHHVERSVKVVRSPRVVQIESLFDVPQASESSVSWDIDVPLEDHPWQVGLVVGPSGSGKSTLISEIFGDAQVVDSFKWGHEAIVDCFPNELTTREITGALSKAGLSSVPSWLRPYGVLSNGERFRADVARAVVESKGLVVMDEFTSVVDRQVAKVASHTTQKMVRAGSSQFVAATCHYDVEEWLQPDWVFDTSTMTFTWRSVQPRPSVKLEISQAHRSTWGLFKRHHYMSAEISNAAQCFVATVDGAPVAFNSYIHLVHPHVKNTKRIHRLVVLPDWQGLGIGGRFADWLGAYLHDKKLRLNCTTSHPGMIAVYKRSKRWRQGVVSRDGGTAKAMRGLKKTQMSRRRWSTRTFSYSPPVT